VVPAWSSLTGTRQAAAAEEVERKLVTARSQAVSEGRPIGLHIDPGADTVQFYTIATAGASPTVLINFDGVADAPSLIAQRYPGADIASLVGGDNVGGAQILWFGFDGSPELRSASGTLTGGWTQDAVITLAGGNQITIRKVTGMVVR
jgi:hypothetical protein